MHREKRELSSSLFSLCLPLKEACCKPWFAICDGVEALILGVVILNVVKNPLEVDHIPHVDYVYSTKMCFAMLSMTAYASMSVETYGLQKCNPHGIDAYHALLDHTAILHLHIFSTLGR